jgi:ABC-type multidrug transport system ATPase subunit
MSSAQISLHNVGKRYNHEWIFKGVNHTFKANEHCVILGANGSGKSTLIQTILGSTIPSEGEIKYQLEGKKIDVQDSLGMFSFASPYLELIEEFTVQEQLEFHQKLSPFRAGLTIDSIIDILYLSHAKDKVMKYYSSGMKQRVKLGLALLSDTPFALLDEPTSNLDVKAIEWYNALVDEHKKDRILIVCSNDQKSEFTFCSQMLNLMDYK